MKRYRYSCALLAAAALAAYGTAQSPTGFHAPVDAVTGEVTLRAAGSHAVEQDASKVVVWLVPVETVQNARLATQNSHYRLVQHNKRFEPGLLVVPVGSVVDFPNADPWFHNVFSLYRGKRFDLGLYQAGALRSVRFDRIGPSYLFCNIHPEMTGVVLAVDSELFGVTGKNGRYSIAGVAPGKYVLHVWHENATPESLLALQRTVTIEDNNRVLPATSLTTAKRASTDHKNKYGEDYDPENVKTDY